MAPLEPWEKVLVDGDKFPTTVHGKVGCVECHGGQQDPNKETAHSDIIRNPSEDSAIYCGKCHPDTVDLEENNLHVNLEGYWTVLEARGVDREHPAIEEMFGNHCSSCHATCGECHISQPNLVGGGFIDGHLFKETPSLTRNCTACHGSRVGKEYLGQHEELQADVHFRQARMNCMDCHSGHDLHGSNDDCSTCHDGGDVPEVAPADHRYVGAQQPKCTDCHPDVLGGDDVFMHQQHGEQFSCQVCHSTAYTSCEGCHVALSEKTGKPFFATDESYLGFFIGKNPIQDEHRPYEYVTVRHIPIAEDSFSFYGEDLIPNFEALPTWKYTTPHNIQKNTPQNESCDACHGNETIFLTIDKVSPEEVEANSDVIISVIPNP